MVTESGEKILVALSGGPSSLAVAWILRKQGKQVRGVHLDWFGNTAQLKWVEAFERKLGISIQVITAQAEVESLLLEGVRSSLIEGKRPEIKEFFHQRYLWPTLFGLKEVFHCQKVASGHRVKVQIDTVDQVAHLYAADDWSEDESSLLLALQQKELMALELPLGGLPPSTVTRIAEELNVGTETELNHLDWNVFLARTRQALAAGDRFADVHTLQGMRLGSCRDFALLSPGDSYGAIHEGGRSYQIVEISPEEHRVTVDEPQRRIIQEVHLQDASWVTRVDLGCESLRCQMVWQNQEVRMAAVSLLQFEGGRLKAFVSEPLKGLQADIFNGQTVLFVLGGEVLGGARVMRSK